MKKLIHIVWLALLSTQTSHALINILITELNDGTTEWAITQVDNTYTVGQFNPTGNIGERILLPKQAFDFDYSDSFFFDFSQPIGTVRNETTSSNSNLFRIAYFKHLDELRIDGFGLLSRSQGDTLTITNFSSGTSSIAFSDILTPGNITYSVPGAWYSENTVDIDVIPIPEPASTATVIGFISILYFGMSRRIK